MLVTLVVHPHFHRRRSGATAHIEAVVPALAQHVRVRAMGRRLSPAMPRITVRELLRERGRIVWQGKSDELAAQPEIQHRYLGI